MLVEDKTGKSICIKVFIKEKKLVAVPFLSLVCTLSGLLYGTTCSKWYIYLHYVTVPGCHWSKSIQFTSVQSLIHVRLFATT